MKRITPFLWFDTQAEEAANFYVSVFKNSRILSVLRTGDAGPGPKGSVLTINFELDGEEFVGLNGGPGFPFTQAVSFSVSCTDQAEIDHYWSALTAGGKEVRCGWLVDKFGLSWQVVPANIGKLLEKPEAMRAMMKMVKMDIEVLEAAGKQ